MLLHTPVLLPTPVGHQYYELFYLLGFGAAGGLLLLEGYQRGYSWRAWLLLMAGVQLLLILGTKLIAGSADDWHHMLTHGTWTGPDQRSILGGLLGALLGLALLRRWLGFGRDAYDAFALPFSVGLAVQGVGCLLAGCCFGTHAPASWLGVCYAPGTLPFRVQVARGLLDATAPHSLPVHPAQFYQILLCLSIATALLLTRRQRWPAGWRFGLTLLLYTLGRFGLEFMRDVASDVVGTGFWWHLKPVQWGLLLTLVVLGGSGWAWRHRHRAQQTKARLVPSASLPWWRSLLTVAALLFLTAGIGAQWLAWSERWVVQSLLLVGLGLEAITILRSDYLGFHVLKLSAVLGCLAMLTMSQAPAPQDSTRQSPLRRYTTISMGGMAGTSQQYYDYPYDCSSRRPDVGTYQQHYQVVTIGIARTIPVKKSSTFTFGLQANLGRTHFRPDQDSTVFYSNGPVPDFVFGGTKTLYAVTPFVSISASRYLRYTIGAHIGHVAYDYPHEPGQLTRVWPISTLDVGYIPYVFYHASLGQMSGLGNGTFTMGLGSGFGQNRPVLVAGAAIVNSEFNVDIFDHTDISFTPFLQGQLKLGSQWEIYPYAASNFKHVNQFRLQAHYRLPGR